MSYGYLLIGVLVGALMVGALVTTGHQDIDQDAVCQERFGPEWTSQTMERNITNQSVQLTCTNGSMTEEIGVSVDVEVDG